MDTDAAPEVRHPARTRGRPPGPARDPAQRRAELLDAAERVVHRNGPRITIAEVAAEAGYARTAVYALFPDLSALVDALAERHMQGIIAAADAILAQPLSGHQLVRALVRLICDVVDADPDLHHLLMQRLQSDEPRPPGGARPFFTQAADWATSVFDALLAAVDGDRGLARVWATATVGAILLSAEDWGHDPDRRRGEYVDRLTAFLWPAIESAGGDRFTGPLVRRAEFVTEGLAD